MKKKKYLPLYYKWLSDRLLPDHGVCDSLKFELGEESKLDFMFYFRPLMTYNGLWGYDGYNYIGTSLFCDEYPGLTYEQVAYEFNGLRQNMILLMAAMNNEL